MRHDGVLILNCTWNLMEFSHSILQLWEEERERTEIGEEWIGTKTKMNRSERNGHKFNGGVGS